MSEIILGHYAKNYNYRVVTNQDQLISLLQPNDILTITLRTHFEHQVNPNSNPKLPKFHQLFPGL